MRTNRRPCHVPSKVASAYRCSRYLSSEATFLQGRSERRAVPLHSKVLGHVQQRARRGESETDCCCRENLVQRRLSRIISEQHPKIEVRRCSHSLNAQPQSGRLLAFQQSQLFPPTCQTCADPNKALFYTIDLYLCWILPRLREVIEVGRANRGKSMCLSLPQLRGK